jgi:hypothetical protein
MKSRSVHCSLNNVPTCSCRTEEGVRLKTGHGTEVMLRKTPLMKRSSILVLLIFGMLGRLAHP